MPFIDPMEAALRDWQQEKARYLLIGTPRHDAPLFDKQRGRYIVSVGDAFATQHIQHDAQSFCDTYNRTIEELLEREGPPLWLPLYRLPNHTEALAYLAHYEELASLHRVYFQTRRRIESIIRAWHGVPLVWCHIPERDAYLIGGNSSPRAGRIDVFDSKEQQWFQSYEYRRRHVAHFPWDEYAARSIC